VVAFNTPHHIPNSYSVGILKKYLELFERKKTEKKTEKKEFFVGFLAQTVLNDEQGVREDRGQVRNMPRSFELYKLV